MVDSAYVILTSDYKEVNGKFFIDDEVIPIDDLKKYNYDPTVPIEQLGPDGFAFDYFDT